MKIDKSAVLKVLSNHEHCMKDFAYRQIVSFINALPASEDEWVSELQDLKDERQRQVDKYGYSDEHILTATEDYGDGELAMAAAAYLCTKRWLTKDDFYIPQLVFPWDDMYFKPSPEDRLKELTKAGAMILAEMKRIKSLPSPPTK